MKKAIVSILAVCLLASCANGPNGPQVQGNAAAHVRNFLTDVEPAVRPTVRLAGSLYLDYAANPKDRADLKANIFTASSIAAATTADTTPGDLSKAIQAALGPAPENKQLADSIAGSWGIVLPFVKGDPALILKWVEDISGGLADCTKT